MQSYKKLVDAVNWGALWIAIVTTTVMTVMVLLQILFRYVIQSSLSFSEELARYAFIWATFLGSATALSKRAHVSMEIVVANLPRKAKKGAILVTNCLATVFYLLMVVFGIKMVLRTVDQTSAALGLRMCYVYAAVPISGLIMLLNGIYNGYEEFMNPDIIKSEGVE